MRESPRPDLENRGSPSRWDGPFKLENCGNLAPLKEVLEKAGFTEQALSQTLKVHGSQPGRDLPLFLRRTHEPTPYNTLVHLFVLAQEVPRGAARAALEPLDLDELASTGLIEACDGGIRSTASILPCTDLLIARDFWPEFMENPCPENYVLGVGPSSMAVVNLTVRKTGEDVLDLGCGCGVQALFAARHARKVIATDTNPRALNFTEFNARLNTYPNIETRLGSLYEPVSDLRFDLIVSNPPFVISPKRAYEYRDSGMQGDAVSEQVIRGAPGLLRDGGYCTVLLNWHHTHQDDWAQRPRQWVESGMCDAWILCSDVVLPVEYAAQWLRRDSEASRGAYAALLDEWVAYYRDLGIGRISTGAIILRRVSGRSGWIRAERAPDGLPSGSSSEQIQRIFTVQDMLEGLNDDRELLDMKFVLIPEHQLEHLLQAEDGKWVVQKAAIRQTEGFQFIGNVDKLVATVLAGCTGQHCLGELVNDLAKGLSMDSEKIIPGCIQIIRKLLETGYLFPVQ
ncbi:MAG: methyltransferase [Desulfomonilia bacterium]